MIVYNAASSVQWHENRRPHRRDLKLRGAFDLEVYAKRPACGLSLHEAEQLDCARHLTPCSSDSASEGMNEQS